MARRQQTAAAPPPVPVVPAAVASTGGVPYVHPETGERCTRQEYVAAVREANRQKIVAELRATVTAEAGEVPSETRSGDASEGGVLSTDGP